MRNWPVFIILMLSSSAWAAADFSDFDPIDVQQIAVLTDMHMITEGRGEFTQTKKIPALKKPIISSGYFLYREGQGLLWVSEKPLPSSILVTETGVYELQQDGSFNALKGGEQMGTLLKAIIFNDWEPLGRYFNTSFKGDRQSWCVGLETKSVQVRSILEAVKICGDSEPREVTLFEAKDASTVINTQFIPGQLSEQDALKLDAATQ